jgi:DNA-binding MarR family transcriptional regulator
MGSMPDDTSALCIPRAAKGRAALLLAGAGDLLLQRAEETLSGAGVNGREYLILSILETDGPGSQQEIARLLRKAPAIVVAAVDDLEGRGLVKRARDPADRRRSRVTLTKPGEKALARADRLADDAFARLFDGLDADELEQLKGLLGRGLQGLIDDAPQAVA